MREDNDYIDSHESADEVMDDHDPVTSPPIAYDPQAPAVVVEPKESLFRSLGPSKQSLVLLGFFIALIFVGGVTERVLIQIVAYMGVLMALFVVCVSISIKVFKRFRQR